MERTLPPVACTTTPAEAPKPRAPRLPQLALAVAAAVVLWDFLFFDQIVGFTRGLFTLAATALVVWANPRALHSTLARWLMLGLTAVAVSQVIEPTSLAAMLCWVGLASLGLVARSREGISGIQWPLSWLGVVTRGWFAWMADFSALRAQAAGREGWRGRLGRWLGNWTLPTLLSVPFVVLFAIANPVIEVGIDGLFDGLGDFLSDVSAGRILTWAAVASGLWALLRFRVQTTTATAEGLVAAGRERLRDDMLVRCLMVFNALFAVQTALDAGYFWSGFELPDGMSHAEYAHRGAYPLVGTTLLAIVFILTAFHDRMSEAGDPGRRGLAARLVYVWLAQNLFLLVSAAARLELYVEVYQLTYFRIASAIWMLLVGIGLAWTAVKIGTGRTNAWLIDVNLVTTAAILTLCCFPNYDRLIAEYNVEQAISAGLGLDEHYLARLGPEALPALQRWWDVNLAPRQEYDPDPAWVNRSKLRILQEQQDEWRGWTLRRQALERRIDRSWRPSPCRPLSSC